MRDKTIRGLPLADVLLAAGLFAVKLATLATGIQPGPAALYALLPFWTLPFAWRRRHPVAVATVISATGVVEYGVAGYHNSVVSLLAYVLVAKLAQTRREGRVGKQIAKLIGRTLH